MQGSEARSIEAPPSARRSSAQAGAVAGSNRTRLPLSAFSAPSSSAGSCRRTSRPRCALVSAGTLRPSTNRSTVASWWMIAKDSGSGVKSTSLPRILSSQPIESGADRKAASLFLAVSSLAIRARLSAAERPAKPSGCGTTGVSGAAGRALHTASSGLVSTAINSAPAWAQASLSWATWSGVCSQGS